MTTSSPAREFTPLPLSEVTVPANRRRICIVSHEFSGPSNNGGIGTAYTALADALADAGHDVVCLFTRGTECASQDITHWVRQFHARNIALVPLPKATAPLDAVFYSFKSLEVYQWLKQQEDFDVVHFPEWQGLGYHSQVAKVQGLAFGRTQFCVGLHSMTEWLKTANREHIADTADLQLAHMERQSVAMADVLISPSRYLLQWIEARGWQLPANAHVQQNIMPRSARGGATVVSDEVRRFDELVFFGRLETRKGVVLFCDALDLLAVDAAVNVRQVTFLGKDAMVEGIPGEVYITGRAQKWPWAVQFLKDKNQPQAMDYLRGEGRLAVMPSLMENSPYTVLECLGAGVSFIANRVGGIPELIAAEDVDEVCFDAKPRALAARLDVALTRGLRAVRGAVDAATNELAWVQWHEQLADGSELARMKVPAVWRKVSLCLTTFNRPALLRQALESVELIDYPALEVVLVDDGSTQPDAVEFLRQLEPGFAHRGWQIVRQENRYLGAARNNAARHATGEFLLFMDDDNYAEAHEVKLLVQAMLNSGSDIVSCGMNYFAGQSAPNRNAPLKGRWLPLGSAVAAGAFTNCFGDANALVRRACFESVGGFTEDHGVTHEDWEFHAKAVLAGFKLQVVPEFLFWYRVNASSMLRSLAPYPNYMRSIRPYVAAVPAELRELVLFAQGAALQVVNSGSPAVWAAYAQLTILWRGKLDAALVLSGMGLNKEAVKTMLDGIKAIEKCTYPRVTLEALVEISSHLRRFDQGRAKYLLDIAVKLAEQINNVPEGNRARQLLADLNRKPAGKSQPVPQLAEAGV